MTVQDMPKKQRWRLAPKWVIACVLLLVAAGLWLPFGFNVGFYTDDWFLYLNARFSTAWAPPDRPFLVIPNLVAYALAPGQFAGFNLMLLILLFARSWLCYGILRRLGGGRAAAFAVAILTAVYPADAGVFTMGALNVYFAWVAYLLALYLLILYWQKPRLGILFLMWCALILSLGTYEAAYPLILVSPLVLLFLVRKSALDWKGTLWRWYLFPVLNVVRLGVTLLVNPDAFKYQVGLARASPSIGMMLESIVGVYKRHLVTSWLEEPISASYAFIALAVGVLVFGVCWWLGKSEIPRSTSWYMRFAVAGFGIILLGMAVLLPTSLRNETVRTFFASSIGAALFLTMMLWLLTRRVLLFAALVGLFVALGFVRLVEQHARFVGYTEQQQTTIVNMAQKVPNVAPNSALLIMDETPNRELLTEFWNHWHFQNPFMVAYDDPTLGVALCYPDDSPESSEAYCAFRDEYVEARITSALVWQRPYDHVILVRYTASHEWVLSDDLAPYGNSSVYNPSALIDVDAGLAEPIRTMFRPANS